MHFGYVYVYSLSPEDDPSEVFPSGCDAYAKFLVNICMYTYIHIYTYMRFGYVHVYIRSCEDDPSHIFLIGCDEVARPSKCV